MKKFFTKDFIGDNIVYRFIAVYLLFNCLFELLVGFVTNWEVFSHVI